VIIVVDYSISELFEFEDNATLGY